MDNLLDFIANHVLMNISKVRSSAATCGGECLWHFSQAKDPVRTVISKNKDTKTGICEILSAKWICDDVKGGSMMRWLTGGSGKRGDIDVAKISLLGQIFGTGSNNQENETEAWMRTNDVKPRRRPNGGELQTSDGGGRLCAAAPDPDDMLTELNHKRMSGQFAIPLYALISVAETSRIVGNMGHAMAIKMDASGIVRYFDPNFGEFAFGNWANFRNWYLDYFRISQYAKFMNTWRSLRYY